MSNAAKDVTSRLTDTSKYTGSHANRFDENGAGKGAAGQADIVAIDGSTNAGARQSIATDGAKSKVVVKKWDQKKFGCQADMPVIIYVHCFTKVNAPPTKITVNRTIKKWDQLMKKIPNMDSGRPDKILNELGEPSPKALDELFTESHYLAIGPGIKPADIKKAISGEEVKGLPTGYKAKLRKGVLPKYTAEECTERGITLSDAEKKKVAKLMKFADKDCSQSCEIGELSEMMVMLGYSATEEELESHIQEFDTDNSGGLDIYEFFLLVQRVKGPDSGQDDSKACSIM